MLDFKRRVVTSGDKSFPGILDVELNNTDSTPVTWKFDTKPLLDENNNSIFELEPYEGKLEPGCSTIMRVAFGPIESKE